MVTPKPLNDMVLIEPEPPPDYARQQNYKHVVVPDKYKTGPTDPPRWGKVIAKGNNCRKDVVAVGDRVLYAKFGWSELRWEGKTYALVREGDLLAVQG